MSRTVLVHIGKCGGTTCRAAIRDSTVQIDDVVHIRQPEHDISAHYIILARAPIARALSAFNWRYWLVNNNEHQAARFPGERAILNHYGNLNTLAEQLYFSNGTDNAIAQGNFRSIHHLGESIAFYLDPLLAKITSEQVVGVVMQETLKADLMLLFGIISDLRENDHHAKTSPEMMDLSDRARINLRRFLARDFTCLWTLRNWGKLNPDSLPALEAEATGWHGSITS